MLWLTGLVGVRLVGGGAATDVLLCCACGRHSSAGGENSGAAAAEEAAKRIALTTAVREQLVRAAWGDRGGGGSGGGSGGNSPSLAETLTDVEAVAAQRVEVLGRLADVLMALAGAGVTHVDTAEMERGEGGSTVTEPRQAQEPQVDGDSRAAVFRLLVRWVQAGRWTHGGADGVGGTESSAATAATRGGGAGGSDRGLPTASSGGVARAAVACVSEGDAAAASSVVGSAEALFHLCPPFQRSLAHAMLRAGQLDNLTPLLQGVMALGSQPATLL
jgi:hypothetical protein